MCVITFAIHSIVMNSFLFIFQLVGENPSPNKSRFSIIELPGLEKLSDDPNQLRFREGPALSKALIALNQVVISLASNPYPDRVISYRYTLFSTVHF